MFETPSKNTNRFRLTMALRPVDPDCSTRQSWIGLIPSSILFFLVYFGCEALARAIAFPDQFSPAILLSSGLLLGILIVYDRKDWPAFLIAGLGASILFTVFVNQQNIALGVFLFAGSLLQAVLALLLLQMPEGEGFTFRVVRHVVSFCGAAILVPAIGAILPAFAYSWFYPNLTFSNMWSVFTLANIVGLFVVTPLSVKLFRRGSSEEDALGKLRIVEAVVLLVLLVGACDSIFVHPMSRYYHGVIAQPYLIFPLLFWAAIRFGPRGGSIACFVVAVIASWGSSRGGGGAFQAGSVMSRAALLDAFLVISGAFSMMAAALMAERRWSAFKFQRLFKELEMVNRELKLEINERSSAERMLRAILDGANVSIISTDVNGTILTFNAAAQKLLKYTPEEVIGHMNLLQFHDAGEIAKRAEHLSERLHRPVNPDFSALALTPATGKDHEVEWTYLGKDNTRADVVVFMTALFDVEKHPTRYIAVGRDITLQKKAEAALLETQSAVHNFFENGPLMMGVVEILENNEDIFHISDNIASADFHGTTLEEMRHQLATSLGDTPEHIAFWIEKYRQSESAGAPVTFEYELQQGSSVIHLRATVSFIAVTQAGRNRFSYVMEDITGYRQAQAQNKRLAAILEATTDFVGIADRTGNTLYLNTAAHRMLGLTEGGVPPDHRIYDVHPEWASLLTRREGIPVAMLEGVWQGESALLDAEKNEVPVSQVILSHRSAAGEVDFISTMLRDMTEQKLAEERIRTSLSEKEALLKEIHHRVKNNMQVVSSLLQLQSGYTQDPHAQAMFEESRDRIRSMALIHEKLYQTKDLAHIDFSEYIPSLVNMIFATQNVRASAIRSKICVGAVSFGVDIAIPLGLVINELVSNCMKHAFKNRESGLVTVELQNAADHGYSLIVRDDGAGLPPGFDIDGTSSLGLRLVRILVQQIGGELSVENRGGSYFQINFNETTGRE